LNEQKINFNTETESGRLDSPELEPIQRQSAGSTTIAPDVLLTIARLTTLDVPGVSCMSTVPAGVNRFFHRKYGEGVRIDITDDVVCVDLYIIMKNDINIREVSRQVQLNVTRAISNIVGMTIGRVNVNVEDIDFPF
jgi:uncharacterized alkaline shock family protein YloU